MRCRQGSCSGSQLQERSQAKPRLLILDEANSSFDYGSDQMLARGLLSLKGEVTIVLITNRPSFVAIADRVLTIVDGTFIEFEPVRPRIELIARSAGVIA